MSYLSRILAKESTNTKLPPEFEGIKIVERPVEDFGKREKGGGQGYHYLDDDGELKEDSIEFHRAVDDALSHGYKTMFVYNQGSGTKKPHLYMIKSSADEEAILKD